MIKNKLINDRGQVGIGTLIVFIALVLVAAIAAGVLINTAGFLQTQAEDTGEDSTSQVADNINVIGEVGEVGDANDATDSIYETRLTVQRSPGSSEINLADLSIQWVGDNGFAQLVHVSDKTNDAGNIEADAEGPAENVYFVQVVTADSDNDAVITDDGDRYDIVIPTGVDITAESTASEDDGDNTIEDVTDGTSSVVSTASDAYDSNADVEVDIANDVDFDGEDGQQEVVVDNTQLDLLDEGQRVEMEITTDAGATRNVVVSAPDTLIDQEGETVTL